MMVSSRTRFIILKGLVGAQAPQYQATLARLGRHDLAQGRCLVARMTLASITSTGPSWWAPQNYFQQLPVSNVNAGPWLKTATLAVYGHVMNVFYKQYTNTVLLTRYRCRVPPFISRVSSAREWVLGFNRSHTITGTRNVGAVD